MTKYWRMIVSMRVIHSRKKEKKEKKGRERPSECAWKNTVSEMGPVPRQKPPYFLQQPTKRMYKNILKTSKWGPTAQAAKRFQLPDAMPRGKSKLSLCYNAHSNSTYHTVSTPAWYFFKSCRLKTSVCTLPSLPAHHIRSLGIPVPASESTLPSPRHSDCKTHPRALANLHLPTASPDCHQPYHLQPLISGKSDSMPWPWLHHPGSRPGPHTT